ncbi:TRAP transporter small permease [Pollutimonas bauzanensis]|uniref:TRAP transporter small permease protein n=1 Tax=Pollutimonas bauzanensis TaxID=658167 RepID=A0A1M5UQ68_9BURK|nr:TRAP transporter small permease [Pollutimonas bauzanensis]SHH65099.1 TRAP-type C4-dicarboxylate transport system, small permease component [Pollutimonas bauzanensis]
MIRLLVRGTEYLLVLMLGLMIILVFGNVALRYLFNSGLVFSEEVSRFLFMWLTLIGALLVMKDRAHLGMSLLVARMGVGGQRILRFASDLAALACCGLLTDGAWKLVAIAMDEQAPVTGVSMGLVYSSLLVCSVGMSLLLLHSLWRQITGQMRADELLASDSTAGE